MHMLSRNKIKSSEEQKLGEGGDDKQVIKLMWPKTMYLYFLGYQPVHDYLEQYIRTLPSHNDSDYEIDMDKNWVDMGSYVPIPLP